jgi:hypothetical protein
LALIRTKSITLPIDGQHPRFARAHLRETISSVVFRKRGNHQLEMPNMLSIVFRPIRGGWAVCLTNGRQLARFRGPGARTRAVRYVESRLALGGRAG